MRIELYLAILVISLYLYLPEVFIPFILRRLTDRREVPSGILNPQILTGILHRDIRNTDLILHRLIPLFQRKSKIHPRVTAFRKRMIRM